MFQQLLYFQKGLGQTDPIVGVGENTVAQPVDTYHKRQPQIAHLHLPVQGSQGLRIPMAGCFHHGKRVQQTLHRGMIQTFRFFGKQKHPAVPFPEFRPAVQHLCKQMFRGFAAGIREHQQQIAVGLRFQQSFQRTIRQDKGNLFQPPGV